VDVAITGSTGLIGSALVERLTAAGHGVIRIVRPSTERTASTASTASTGDTDTAGGRTVAWDPEAGTIDGAGLEGVDAVVNLAGRPIGSKRFTEEEKRRVRDSRVKGTRLIADTVAALARPPAVLVNASAIGYYGSRDDTPLTEQSAPGQGFMADLVVDWERATAPAAGAGIRTVTIRTGLVLQPGEQILGRLLPIFRLGLGGRLASGRQWWSWIALEDEVGALVHLLTADVSGPVNLTAPHPVTNAEFTKTLARVLRRPAVLPVPVFALRLVLGRELADEVAMAGARVQPTKLHESGYQFAHPELESTLRSLLR
jgi:uncharacterized protein (TIGR01777 family)